MKRFIWLFVLGLFFLLLAYERVEIRRYGMEVSKLKQEVMLKEATNQYLRFTIAQMSAPEKVYTQAQDKLGLHLTKPQNIESIDLAD